MLILKVTVYLAAMACVFATVDFKTKIWMWKNKNVFTKMMYNEQEIMNLKDNIDTFKTGNITQFKTFWTKHTTPSPSCGSRWEWQWWYNANIRRKRSECSACCTTDLGAIAPEQIDYKGKSYDVYHPTGGYQILFVGTCSSGASCSHGTCEVEDDYHTWILVHDPAMNYTPEIRFVPVSYSKFCKCVNSS